jgi:hypothetical protein
MSTDTLDVSPEQFINKLAVTGTFRKQLGSWECGDTGEKLVVMLVVARDNYPESPKYEDSMHMFNGVRYEVSFKGKVYQRVFDDDLKLLVSDLLKQHTS